MAAFCHAKTGNLGRTGQIGQGSSPLLGVLHVGET